MHYVYLLHSSLLDEFYVGSTGNLRTRFYSHNSGKNFATKDGMPWRLVYYEAYSTKHDAIRREKKLKMYGQGLRRLKERISIVDKS